MRTIELWGGPSDGETRAVEAGSQILAALFPLQRGWWPVGVGVVDVPVRPRTGTYKMSLTHPNRFDWQFDLEDFHEVGSP